MSQDDDRTDIHERDNFFGSGDVVGHGDGRRRIRGRDGWLLPGDELGYIDRHAQVHKRDGFVFAGETVGTTCLAGRAPSPIYAPEVAPMRSGTAWKARSATSRPACGRSATA